MGKSGYFARKCMLLVSGMKLRNDEKVCESVHPLQLEVKTPEHFRRLIGRKYRLPNQNKYSILTKDDTHVIGKKIYLKSPITCASKKGVCKDCYGPDLYHTNKDGVGIGAFAGAIITNPLSQAVLSSKHLLTTTSEPIEFNEDFQKFFNLNANEVSIKTNGEYFVDDYSLLLIDKNIVTLDELNEGEINKFCTIYHVRNNRTNEIYEITEKTGKEMYLSPEMIEMVNKRKKSKEGVYEIKFSDIPDDERLFLLQIENRELTRPLYKIMSLLDTVGKRADLGITNIHDLAQVFLDLLIESKINVMSIQAEVMLAPLIRSVEDVLERPNFKKYDAINDIQMLTISSALEKHPSVLIGLSSQFLGRQLVSPLTFRKHGESFLDAFYKESL